MGGNSSGDGTTEKLKPSEEAYEEIIMNAMRFLGKSLAEAEIMTLREYTYEMEAYQLRQVDEEYRINLLAWQINQAQATKTKGSGKNQKTLPYYESFKKFFDYEKRINEVNGTAGKTITDNTLSRLMGKANS
ncbi:hypothetical protein SDC9_102077 [bioreactor metagenome]|uniref:Uncharacterized protein n=1 Tax=bioreactor metagenome TaxID=1076179 RepID=A0A645AWK0_9ZZZZ